MKLNDTERRTDDSSWESLREIVHPVIGQPCWKACLGYADELRLHLGARVPYAHAKLAGKFHGEWDFGSRGTTWELVNSFGPVTTSDDSSETIQRHLRVLEGTTVTGFDVERTDLRLTVSFSNGCQLRLISIPSDDEWEMPYWELFAPNHMLLTFGPGGVWTYERSNVPTVA